ncbi:TPA: Rep protein [Bacillus paranthracis]
MSIQAYNTRVLVSGNVVEVYKFKDTIFRGYEVGSRSAPSKENIDIDFDTGEIMEKDTHLESRAKSNIRARNHIRRLTLANFSNKSKFLTLTFKENETDLKRANERFKEFVKKVRKHEQKDFKYLAVIEFQKRGAIHYHIICNLKYLKAKKIEEYWGQGFIKINRINHVDNIGAYVVKYMTKEDADERLIGKKMYQCSKGLDKPKELIGAQAEYVLAQLEKEGRKKAYSSEYENRQTGNKIEYMEYNLSRK